MTAVNVNIPDSELEALTGPQIKAQIAAITGQPEKKIATRSDGLKTLRRLRQWAMNIDGMLGVPKGTNAQVRTLADLRAKAAAKGKEFDETPPKAHERVDPIDPEWDDEADIVDGNEAITEAATIKLSADDNMIDTSLPQFEEPAPNGVIETRDQPEAMPPAADDDMAEDADPAAPVPTIPAAPPSVATPRGVEVQIDGETVFHPRGTMRARLAAQAAAAAPIEIAASAMKDRRPKKETGEPRKKREALLGVKATFAGTTKNHKGSLRHNILIFIQAKATREAPGWPVGTVLPAEVDSHFGEACKPYLHKLIEDGHLERVVPLLPGQKAQAKKQSETVNA